MARATGLEPATSGVTGRHSNQLSYARAGVIATCGGLGSGALPVKENGRMTNHLVGGDGLEPPPLSV